VKDWDQPTENNVVEGEDIDMALYEVNLFQQMLDQHVLWAYVFFSHSFENGGLWLERHPFQERFSKIKVTRLFLFTI